MRHIGVEERRARLARRHHLAQRATGKPGEAVARVTGDLVGLHATDPMSIFLAAWARVDGFAPDHLEQALYEDRAVVRMLAMRRTMFVERSVDVPMLQAAASDAVAAVERRKLAKVVQEHGIAEDGERWITAMTDKALAALDAMGEASASELIAQVPELQRKVVLAPGKSYEATVSIGTRLFTVLGVEGHIVRGRPRGSWLSTQHRWQTHRRWFGDGEAPRPDAAAARAELARRWLATFGPATEADVKWWTGWTLGQTRAALRAIDAVQVDLDGQQGLVIAGDEEPEPAVAAWVALLPALDPTAMGWEGREWYLGPHKHPMFDPYGNIGPSIWVDGRIVGAWAQRPDGEIVTRLLEDVGAEHRAAIDGEAEVLTAWLGDVRFTPRFRSRIERELAKA